jgi:hypothetical protein
VDFSIMKNPTASVGSEPAISGSRGQHANPYTTEAAKFDPQTFQPVASRYTV